MATENFDEQFRKLYTAMVEIAFDHVNRNAEEVDEVYIYASMEEGNFFYNFFYKINGSVIQKNKINTVSKYQYDVSSDKVFSILDEGIKYLEETAELFKNDNREVPTLMKMTYHPKTGKFNNDISYDLHYSNHPERTNVDGFYEWFVEMGGIL